MFADMKDTCLDGNASSSSSTAPPPTGVSTITCPRLWGAEAFVERKGSTVMDPLVLLLVNESLLWMVLLLSTLSVFLVFFKRKRHCWSKRLSYTTAAIKRKNDFLFRSGESYGYGQCESGHIDTWRPKELPNLIPPVETTTHSNNTEHEVYLDYAGAALPTQTQLHKIMESLQSILANPHSTGPAASRTLLLMEQAKKRVMDHFECHPGRFAGLTSPPESCTATDFHPGYDVVWTSGATESLRIISERFPWTACEQCENRSTLVYSQNSHTSVVGMRGPALSKSATFECQPLSDICNADSETIQGWNSSSNSQCKCCRDSPVSNLLVFPLQCNFGGDKADATNVIQTCRMVSSENRQWYTMLDLAKAATTDPINLRALDPDFACISFYKMFGEPTGLGALFVKRSAVKVLMNPSDIRGLDRYFGGGSVDAVLPRINFAVERNGPSPLASLVNGSVHFRGIASLVHGFDEIVRLGGMETIRRHTSILAAELVRRLKALRHGSGRPAIAVYGAWANVIDLDSGATLLPGPTVAFNVLRDDGSFVGYNEVSKLAGLNRPPLQLRTGCFCNAGACQAALQLSDEEVQSNYLTSNHVCGDHIDIINEKPTGAIRASFGKDSTWEDMDSLVMFLAKNFVNEGSHVGMITKMSSVITEVQLSELYIFPIKSCSAQRVDRWAMHTESGRLAFDREFALVDSSGTAMRLQNHPRMSLFEPNIDLVARSMTVRAPGCKDLVILLDDKGGVMNAKDSVVKVCGNKCGGILWGDLEASDWFTSFLGVRCWLARHCGDRYELADSRGGIAFANEAPLLLLSQHSVETLNEVLVSQGQDRVSSRRFRPNLVVRSTAPSGETSPLDGLEHANPEDQWTALQLIGNNLELNVVGQCARCSMVDVDPETGAKQKTLRALADYRRRNGQITFGVFLRSESRKSRDETVWLKEGDRFKCT